MNIYVKRALRNKKFLFLAFLSIIMILVALFAHKFAPNDPLQLNYDQILQPESLKYPMGTDALGRCIFSRILYGGKSSLILVFVIVAMVSTMGTIIGILSAMMGGVVDSVIMRIIDMLLAFPMMIILIAIVTFLGVGVLNILLAMMFMGWVSYARLSRGITLSILNSEYMQEARLGGASQVKLIRSYIMPNVIPHMIVMITQNIGDTLLMLASLSLLGLGAQPPTPEWGYMLSEGKSFMQNAPWTLFYPGGVILINVIIFNLLGDSVRDILDPKQG